MEITDVNKLNRVEFVKVFGNIVECFPNVADDLFDQIPFKNVDHIVESAQECLETLSIADKETILKLHPDLAGKLADEGKLTAESTEEQKAAGLDKLTLEEKKQLNDLNKKYKEKFEFPFVICARENKANSILIGLHSRMNNTKNIELTTGINEVKKICKLRIEDLVENS